MRANLEGLPVFKLSFMILPKIISPKENIENTTVRDTVTTTPTIMLCIMSDATHPAKKNIKIKATKVATFLSSHFAMSVTILAKMPATPNITKANHRTHHAETYAEYYCAQYTYIRTGYHNLFIPTVHYGATNAISFLDSYLHHLGGCYDNHYYESRYDKCHDARHKRFHAVHHAVCHATREEKCDNYRYVDCHTVCLEAYGKIHNVRYEYDKERCHEDHYSHDNRPIFIHLYLFQPYCQ